MSAAISWLEPPCVMGILNVTPDSFADGGRHLSGPRARSRLAQIAEEGAAICDVGAESTRPGAHPVPADEQLRRLDPVLAELAAGRVGVPVSIDTTSARVAAAALEAGAVLVNDVSAGRADEDMLPLVADRGAQVCLMHMRGTPRDMQDDPRYEDVAAQVAATLRERMDAARAAGVPAKRMLVDPGIGFGKTLEHNLRLLAEMPRLAALGPPVLVGVSRKGMFGELLGRAVQDRLPASIGAALAAVAGGASVVRAHDVRATVDALSAWSAIRGAGA